MLQSLGWATLNSFWQFALLWCFYLVANHYFRLTSPHKYSLAVFSILTGFAWFVYTFVDFYQGGKAPLFEMSAIETGTILPQILSAASVAYLSLLMFPAYRLLRNWNFIQKIRRQGLSKAPLEQRLFVNRISSQLGIARKVMVYVSSLVKSPVTVGYLKPIILLPLASFNQLSLEQTEAILLHELSHIRRSDYLVNLLLTLVQGILYFNPFVKFLIDKAEQERENACDELVLQFQYDKVSYASALLQLEKSARHVSLLAIGAAQKNHLLGRIEKIVGIAKKPSFERVRFAGAFVFLLIFLAANTMMLSGNKKFDSISLDPLTHHFTFFTNEDHFSREEVKPVAAEEKTLIASVTFIEQTVPTTEVPVQAEEVLPPPPFPEPAPSSPFVFASYNEAEALSQQQKEQISTTLANTKKLLETVQWKEVEKQIADAMTEQEKAMARQEYMMEVNKLNWKQLEQNLKTGYDQVNWEKVNGELKEAMAYVTADSMLRAESARLLELNKIQIKLNNLCVSVIPDASVKEVKKARAQVAQKVEELKSKRARPIVSL